MSDDLQSEAQLTDDLRDLMSATPWNIALITHTGTIEMVSEPLLKLLGASRERLLGRPFTTLVQPAERARLTAA
ncbi:MAG TPA: PAS domain-containing protein, partial [Kouleothrix sp.]|nr:PAS domain-containing protein [Kouleothrix sp.]